jgi:hypothetical protein
MQQGDPCKAGRTRDQWEKAHERGMGNRSKEHMIMYVAIIYILVRLYPELSHPRHIRIDLLVLRTAPVCCLLVGQGSADLDPPA